MNAEIWTSWETVDKQHDGRVSVAVHVGTQSTNQHKEIMEENRTIAQ